MKLSTKEYLTWKEVFILLVFITAFLILFTWCMAALQILGLIPPTHAQLALNLVLGVISGTFAAYVFYIIVMFTKRLE